MSDFYVFGLAMVCAVVTTARVVRLYLVTEGKTFLMFAELLFFAALAANFFSSALMLAAKVTT